MIMSKQSFENALKKLEQIVQEMESGDLPLEKALDKFEEGVKLSKFCFEKLDETEKRITLLLKDPSGKIVEQPFENGDDTLDG